MKTIKLVSILLVIAMIFSLCACKKIEEKIAEKGMEKLMESATGSEVDITKDGMKIGADGESIQTGENLDWPRDAMGELPKPKAKVTFAMLNDKNKGGSVTLAEMELNDAKEYVEKLKEMGFKDGMSMEDSDGIVFSGTTDKGAQVNFMYNPTGKEGSITYGIEQ